MIIGRYLLTFLVGIAVIVATAGRLVGNGASVTLNSKAFAPDTVKPSYHL